MNLLDLYEGREPHQQAIDRLEQRRIEDLEARMDDCARRGDKEGFQKCKAERDSYHKIKEADAPAQRPSGSPWAHVQGGAPNAGLPDVADKTEKMARATPPTTAGKVASTVKNAAKWLAGKGGPGKEGPTYESDNSDEDNYEQVLDAIAALYGPEIWDNDAMGDLANDLEQVNPTPQELDFIIKHGKLPKRLQGMQFTNNDTVQFGEGANDIEDRGEYDQEGDMAKDNIHTIVRNARELESVISDNDNLPEWVQDKLANVKGMITAVSEYMQTQHERDNEDGVVIAEKLKGLPTKKLGTARDAGKSVRKFRAQRGLEEAGTDSQWSKESDWKVIPKAKSGQPVDPRGEVTHLSDVARREAERKAAQKKNPKEVAEEGSRPRDLGAEVMLKKARAAFPIAGNDAEALALYIADKEQRDVNRLERENDEEDALIARIMDQLKKTDVDEASWGGSGPAGLKTPYAVYTKQNGQVKRVKTTNKIGQPMNTREAEAYVAAMRKRDPARWTHDTVWVAPADHDLGEEKTRLDPKCWTGKKIGTPKTKVKGGVRVNNCVPAESINEDDQVRLGAVQPGTAGYDSWYKSTHKTTKPGEKMTTTSTIGKQVQAGAGKKHLLPKVVPEDLGDTGMLDNTDIANIQHPNASDWQATRGQHADAIAKAAPATDVNALKTQMNTLSGGQNDAWEKTYQKYQTQQAADNAAGYNKNVQYTNEVDLGLDPDQFTALPAHVTSQRTVTNTNGVNDLSTRSSSVTGPTAGGDYRVRVTQGPDKTGIASDADSPQDVTSNPRGSNLAANYTTKTPPQGWMVDEQEREAPLHDPMQNPFQGLPDSMKSQETLKQTTGQPTDFKQRISSVQGPNTQGEYNVSVVQNPPNQTGIASDVDEPEDVTGTELAANYITKNPPKSWMQPQHISMMKENFADVVAGQGITNKKLLKVAESIDKLGQAFK